MKTKWQILSMISEYRGDNDLHSRLSSHSAWQTIMKYRNHPSINIIWHFSKRYSSFIFHKLKKILYWKKSEDWVLRKLFRKPIFQSKCRTYLSSIQWSHMFIKISCNFQTCKCKCKCNTKGNRNQKDNYRPISILPIISKIFEKLICRQLSNHFDNIFSKFQCGFRKGFRAQQSAFNDRQMEKSSW